MPHVAARLATLDDLGTMESLYRSLVEEMTPLSHMWPLADGLAEPVDQAFRSLITDEDTVAAIGTIDEVTFGFLVARIEPMLPQADGRRIGAIRLLFVDHPAREVGVGEAMLNLALETLRARGITTFDAHVLPGHRLVKNFFEAGGFKARSIVMSRFDRV